MTAQQQLRLGVVGYGNRGVIAQRAAAADGHSEVVAVYDPHPAAHRRAREQLGADVRIAGSLEELTGLDAVFLTSPDDAHEDQAVALLHAGVPLFVDKPLAITLEGADRILQAAYDSGTKLYVGHNMRHMPVIRQLKQLVDEGRIGEVKAVWCRYFVGDGGDRFFKDWHADRRRVNSLLLQKGAHDIDVIHWLAGGYSRRVSAMGGLSVYGGITDRHDGTGDRLVRDWLDRDHNWPPLANTGLNPVVDVEDISMMTMQLDNGAFATYNECHFTPDYWRNYTVIGTEGRLENFGLGGEGGYVRLWNRRTEFKEHGDEEFPIPQVIGGHHGADPALLAEFLRFVRDGTPTETSPVAAREAVAAGALATASMRGDGSAQVVPPLSAHIRDYFDNGQQPAADHPTRPAAPTPSDLQRKTRNLR
ncbi:Gfo/Idh/MocA family protein [Georgenia sunbinii]|uniref:Gfo/Idh/MocA family protein n=1 Tax=Georgenia sunbinii TaxID=3117728 RepID=UPI002F268572